MNLHKRVATTMCFLPLCLAFSCFKPMGGNTGNMDGGPGHSISGLPSVRTIPQNGETTIVVLVEDGCDHPVEGAAVVVVDPKNAACFYSTTTDVSGTFAVSPLSPESAYDVFVEVKKSWCEASLSTSVVARENSVTLVHLAMPQTCCHKK